ncbi:MAG: hypothetical protein IJ489_04760 [Clostridia bacterium]|nr:hypothetical protein [Clostridia bacterium]
MKKNGTFSAKSFLTLASVLSVLLIFSLVCAGALSVLNRMDLVYFPFENTETEAKAGDPAVSLPIHEADDATAALISFGTASYVRLVREMPFTDNFYLKLRVNHAEGGAPYSGIYEIWRFGDQYRINRYNEQDEVEYMLTCDGERVQLVDFGTLTDSYYMMTDGFFFDDVVPLPDFENFYQGEYEIFEYSETDTLCIAACEYPEENAVDEVQIYKETGLLSSYKYIRDGKTLLVIETLSLNSAFGFSEKMFEIN